MNHGMEAGKRQALAPELFCRSWLQRSDIFVIASQSSDSVYSSLFMLQPSS